jgi:sugar phosphate isomerase/epimerase
MKSKLAIIGIVGKELETDIAGTLRRLRALGYRGIEMGPASIAKFGGPEALASTLSDAGLELSNCMIMRENLREGLDDLLALLGPFGCRYATVAWAPADSLEQITSDSKLYNEVAPRLRAAGVTLCYHNHEHEFTTRFGPKSAMEWLMEKAQPDHLAVELDVAWACAGGCDPVVFLKRYPGRVPLVHLKDLYHRDLRGCFTAHGTGIIDLAACMETASAHGTEWLVVEQDQPRRLRGLDLATAAALNLRELGLEPT